jgi:hypothetical protein
MKTWDSLKLRNVDTPKEMIDFFNEIETVCKKHGLSISHQDNGGAFEIVKYSPQYMEWLRDANKLY